MHCDAKDDLRLLLPAGGVRLLLPLRGKMGRFSVGIDHRELNPETLSDRRLCDARARRQHISRGLEAAGRISDSSRSPSAEDQVTSLAYMGALDRRRSRAALPLVVGFTPDVVSTVPATLRSSGGTPG